MNCASTAKPDGRRSERILRVDVWLRKRCPGGARLERNFLHAAAIEFTHPRTGEPLPFNAPLPAELEDFLVHCAEVPAAQRL